MSSIRLTRSTPNAPWGFRIHGGKDFNQPLVILKVTNGSIAENCGLAPGDAILRINNTDALDLRHKQAQDLILNGGNSVELIVQKGATSTWKPNVTPLGELNSQQKVFTQTSLKKESGPGYTPAYGINSRARPFTHIAKDGRTLVNNQFNSPINMYSDQNIKETLTAQSEVLAPGVIGVDFKKNEKPYKYENSEVYKMLKEVENDPSSSHGDEENRSIQIPIQNYAPPQQSPSLLSQQSLLKSVKAPETKPSDGSNNPNLCSECERLIIGVFVRIKDKNLHVDCFKCATCGQSLKNIGYFNINNKLYCDVHAKSFAKNHPPASGLEPYLTNPTLPKHIFSVDSQGNELLQDEWKSDQTFGTLQNGTDIGASSTYNAANTVSQSIPINVKPFSYTKQPSVDTYAANVAPQPYHHSPTQAHHVTAPKSPVKPISQPLFPSSVGGGLSGSTKSSSQIYETKSSSFSETITKSGGSKFVWPPANKPAEEDQVMMASDVVNIPIQQQSSYSATNSYSSFGTSGATEQQQQQQLSSSYSPGGTQFGSSGLSNTFSSVQAPSFSATAPSLNTYNSPAAGYKPVAPPKPSFKQQQVPYKPVSSLLTTATKPAAMPSPPIASPKIAPPFGGPSAFGGGGSLLAGAPLTARGKGQFGRGFLPTRGKGILTQPTSRIAVCGVCQKQIRGPFILATGNRIYCPEHFKCATASCKRPLVDVGFVEEKNALYCEFCWEGYLAPECGKCRRRIKNECLNALGQQFHPACFACSQCNAIFGNSPFYLEDGRPYCERDWNEMFTTKCYACGFPIEAGDRWVEAMSNNYHSQCFNCTACKKNLEGQSFFAKGGRPFCKQHAR